MLRLKTTAQETSEHYILNGTKNWITNSNSASGHLVIAQSDPEKNIKESMHLLLKELGWNKYV